MLQKVAVRRWPCASSEAEPTWRVLTRRCSRFRAADLPIARVQTIAPAIDPLSPKNIDLDPRMASQILDWIGMEIPADIAL